jgi:hypothetical protein
MLVLEADAYRDTPDLESVFRRQCGTEFRSLPVGALPVIRASARDTPPSVSFGSNFGSKSTRWLAT